jgi:hypothetical protein
MTVATFLQLVHARGPVADVRMVRRRDRVSWSLLHVRRDRRLYFDIDANYPPDEWDIVIKYT